MFAGPGRFLVSQGKHEKNDVLSPTVLVGSAARFKGMLRYLFVGVLVSWGVVMTLLPVLIQMGLRQYMR